MSEQRKEFSLLRRFSQNENKISLLYSAYAQKFPEQADLWERLARDEKRHSALLLDLDERFSGETGKWQLSDNAPAILDYISNFIDDCLVAADKTEFDFRFALKNALSLEQSMIEKKSFEIFATANPEIIAVLEKLNRETEGHRQGIMKVLKNEVLN